MKEIAGTIEELTRNQAFNDAYLLAKQHAASKDKFVLNAIDKLEKALFSRCMDLANNKATEFSKEMGEADALLKKVKAL